MPLTPFQSKILKLLSKNRTPDSYLAGGATLHFEPQSIHFHDTDKSVAVSFEKDKDTLIKNKIKLDIDLHQLGYIRAIASDRHESTKIEWAHDSAWRFLPTLYYEDRGYTLHPIDLAINKVLALVGRDEPRDFLDVQHASQNILSLGALVWAACGKDPGYTP